MTTQRRSIMILLGAIAAGVLSVVMAMQWTNKKIAGSVTHVVVAARDIGPGEKLGSTICVSWIGPARHWSAVPPRPCRCLMGA